MFSILRTPSTLVLVALAWLLQTVVPSDATAQQVFSTDFGSGIPAEFSAPGCEIAPVQGWSGLGPAGRQFSGSFLRYTSVPLHPTTLTLNGLPAHDRVDLRFLLAIIDSWDGAELLKVSVDGTEIFSHWFQIATANTSSYVPPPGALLSSGTALGFSNGGFYNRDRAYDLGVDPVFLQIPHTSSSIVVSWTLGAVSGPAANQWQGGADESWAIDEVSVIVSSSAVNVPVIGSAGGLALDGAWPNPSRGGPLSIRFALPNASAATLDLVDVAGRIVTSRSVGALGAGRHRLDLRAEGRLAPGVYYLRLTQGSDRRVTRAVVLD